MSGKQIKRIKKKLKRDEQKVKIEGLNEFMYFTTIQPLKKRLVFAFRIIFKRV